MIIFHLTEPDSLARTSSPDSLFYQFIDQYNSGSLIEAESVLNLILVSKDSLNEQELVSVLNNLGVVNQMLGRYDKALEFYNQAELSTTYKKEFLNNIADIYTNKGNIHLLNKSYDLAIAYLEKSIRVYSSMNTKNPSILYPFSSTYLNAGIVFLIKHDYKKALEYFNKSLEIKYKYGFQGTELVYMNLAKTWNELKDPETAEKYYLKSIEKCIYDFSENYFRLAEVYFDYGLFLDSRGRFREALEIHRKALNICLNNYGKKHTLVALAYKNLGDHYFRQSDFVNSLEYYQQSLISVVRDFDNTDVYSNPSIDSVLFNVRLFENLKSKAKALESLAYQYDEIHYRINILNKSLETAGLALQLINRIRHNILSEESRIYISDNEKETYLYAIHLAASIHSLTGDISMVEKMYEIACQEKAALMRNQIMENELFFLTGIPDSVREKRNHLEENIAALNKMIIDESVKVSPDSNRISLWKDALFNMNRDLEKTISAINSGYPQFRDLLQKAEPLPLSSVRRRLHKNETILDFIFSERDINNERDLYVFVITGKKLQYLKLKADTVFVRHAGILNSYSGDHPAAGFSEYTTALNYMYKLLIEPAEKHFAGEKLIIIPDEETSWLPFDAFLPEKPEPSLGNYDGLKYLINNYTVSFSYSASMVKEEAHRSRRKGNVLAFYPLYNNDTLSHGSPAQLPGAALEIRSVMENFRGRIYEGSDASVKNFLSVINEPVIFHLAMHSVTDSVNSKYSFLLFDGFSDTLTDGKLYNYEISSLNMRSPLVVISSCNSGAGTLYQAEGLMSIARSFRLAGASSVVKTAWKVNDETSARIVSRFYYYLSKGKYTDEALRLSKLDYLKDMPPAFSGPYFWAAYELTGDNSPVAPGLNIFLVSVIIFVLVVAGMLYFRIRRIFFARSL